jgi:hypothetical protein
MNFNSPNVGYKSTILFHTNNNGKKINFLAKPDPYFSDVSLLMHMDGNNGSTIFTDSSLNNFEPTVNGNAQISTLQKKYGNASAYFDKNNSYLTFNNNEKLNLQGDSTIEMWIYINNIAQNACLISKGNVGAGTPMGIIIGTSNKLWLLINGSPTLISSTTLVSNQWYHIAFVCINGQTSLFINGIFDTIYNTGLGATNGNLYIGTESYEPTSSSRQFEGYIDDLRITKGVGRYTTNFEPPKAAFPNF